MLKNVYIILSIFVYFAAPKIAVAEITTSDFEYFLEHSYVQHRVDEAASDLESQFYQIASKNNDPVNAMIIFSHQNNLSIVEAQEYVSAIITAIKFRKVCSDFWNHKKCELSEKSQIYKVLLSLGLRDKSGEIARIIGNEIINAGSVYSEQNQIKFLKLIHPHPQYAKIVHKLYNYSRNEIWLMATMLADMTNPNIYIKIFSVSSRGVLNGQSAHNGDLFALFETGFDVAKKSTDDRIRIFSAQLLMAIQLANGMPRDAMRTYEQLSSFEKMNFFHLAKTIENKDDRLSYLKQLYNMGTEMVAAHMYNTQDTFTAKEVLSIVRGLENESIKQSPINKALEDILYPKYDSNDLYDLYLHGRLVADELEVKDFSELEAKYYDKDNEYEELLATYNDKYSKYQNNLDAHKDELDALKETLDVLENELVQIEDEVREIENKYDESKAWLFAANTSSPTIKSIISEYLLSVELSDLASYWNINIKLEAAENTLSQTLAEFLPKNFQEKRSAWETQIIHAYEYWMAKKLPNPIFNNTSFVVETLQDKYFEELPIENSTCAQKQVQIQSPSFEGDIPVDPSQIIRFENANGAKSIIYSSVEFDRPGEVPAYGYFFQKSAKDNKGWERPVYLGQQQFFPYQILSNSDVPLLSEEGKLTIEVDVRSIDPSSISFPPVGLVFKEERCGIILSFDLAALMKDSDKDRLTDIVEMRLGLNPFHGDTDFDGIPDGFDSLPLTPYNISTSEADTELAISIIEKMIGFERNAIVVEPPSNSQAGASAINLNGAPEYLTELHTQFFISDNSIFSGIQLPFRLMIYNPNDIKKLGRGDAPFYPAKVTNIFVKPDQSERYVIWSASWSGGSFIVRCDELICQTFILDEWIS